MDIMFLDDAWQDYLYWQKADKKILKRIIYQVKNDCIVIVQCRYHY